MPSAETKSVNRRQSPSQSNPKTHRKPNRKTDQRPLIGADIERCVYCNDKYIKKVGMRHKQHEIIQRWYCHQCAVLAPVRNFAKITGFKVDQTGLRMQLSIDALSQKKGASGYWGPF
jgi:hypothetical protein